MWTAGAQPAVEPPEVDDEPDDEEPDDEEPDEPEDVEEDSLAPDVAGALAVEEPLLDGPSAALAAFRLSVR